MRLSGWRHFLPLDDPPAFIVFSGVNSWLCAQKFGEGPR